MVERYEIEAFLTLVEELHFGRTAERMRVSTARVSQAIKKLERRIGVPLFHRTSRRVQPTDIGRRLAEDLRPAWDQIETGIERAVEAGRGMSGTLHVAFVTTAGSQLLAHSAELFRSSHPECDVRVREARPKDVIRWLRDAELDVALTCLPVRASDIVSGPPLVSEALFLATPVDNHLARRTSVSLTDLAGVTVLPSPNPLPDLGPEKVGSRPPANHRPETGSTPETFEELLALIGAGRGVCPVGAHARRYHPRPDVAYVPFSDAPRLRWALVWHNDHATARVRAFSQVTTGVAQGVT